MPSWTQAMTVRCALGEACRHAGGSACLITIHICSSSASFRPLPSLRQAAVTPVRAVNHPASGRSSQLHPPQIPLPQAQEQRRQEQPQEQGQALPSSQNQYPANSTLQPPPGPANVATKAVDSPGSGNTARAAVEAAPKVAPEEAAAASASSMATLSEAPSRRAGEAETSPCRNCGAYGWPGDNDGAASPSAEPSAERSGAPPAGRTTRCQICLWSAGDEGPTQGALGPETEGGSVASTTVAVPAAAAEGQPPERDAMFVSGTSGGDDKMTQQGVLRRTC